MIQNASRELVLDFLHEDKNAVCILGWKLLLFEDWANQKKKDQKRRGTNPKEIGYGDSDWEVRVVEPQIGRCHSHPPF